ncbi:MAG: sigma-70 family RNA polymerase sigma factor [Acidobacteriia bacterium]|nr:sigma-70 family RNA polymerase sigma factor [Terriglobia bacterium]
MEPYRAELDAQELAWIQAAQRGDREAFGRLVERYQQRVFAQVFRLVRRREDVEDLAQEVFVKAFRAIRGYNFRSSFATWLSRVAVNHCYDFLRRERSRPPAYAVSAGGQSDQPLDVVDRLESSEQDPERQAVLRDLVGKLLARAPADDRVVLVLKEIEGLSVEEIGEILELKPGAVKVRLFRARKRMLEDWRNLRQEK